MEAELVSEIGPFQKAKKNPKTKLKASRYSQQAQIAVPQHTRTETAGLPFSLNASRQEILQAALKSSLTSGFIDTQFYAFTRRTISGFVVKASPIFANSIAMRSASPKFDHLLMGGFSESAVARMNSGLYCDQQVSIDTYGYESDSDLDDDDERPDEKSEMDIVQKKNRLI
ncbi:hypothetical protein AcW1_009268 [Taiwanofungus camphoratus]|nr:hypothetical protein AcV5_007293 [Antrodia cinnamomea]KAI0949747.1 hypothetical protein AcW1_009268 [Antrodia cinnamomea]KAI0958430.1 hypothetical protein AcV7_004256 [Antrodia cinnamomea]